VVLLVARFWAILRYHDDFGFSTVRLGRVEGELRQKVLMSLRCFELKTVDVSLRSFLLLLFSQALVLDLKQIPRTLEHGTSFSILGILSLAFEGLQGNERRVVFFFRRRKEVIKRSYSYATSKEG